uniref:Kazal/vWf domain containing protein n=1 Tax=Rhipicephalus appendiculatus TaxID=34631 RepID=A0A131Z411_RHIAP
MASPLTAACRVRSLVLYWAICVAIFSACVCAHDHAHSHSSKPSKAVQFRERWDATDVIRDVEHIKEDLATLVDMQSSGEMTDEEITFYFFRMHDFDDNTMLDGIEFLSAMQHTIDHGFAPGVGQKSLDDMIQLVDGAFALDTNNDGFISYPELRVTLKQK